MKILFVDDHSDTARLAAHLLGMEGHEVQTAGSVREAMQLCENQMFEVLVCDLGLPDGTGYDLMKELLGKCPIKAIALSGRSAPANVDESLKAGFLMHIVKPVDFDKLNRAITALAEK